PALVPGQADRDGPGAARGLPVSQTDDALWGVGGAACVALAIGCTTYALATTTDTPLHRAFDRYAALLDRKCRLLYLQRSGRELARYELLASGALVLGGILLEELVLFSAAAAVFLLTHVWLDGRLATRRRALDAQLDSFLVTLANALRASPALGDA